MTYVQAIEDLKVYLNNNYISGSYNKIEDPELHIALQDFKEEHARLACERSGLILSNEIDDYEVLDENPLLNMIKHAQKYKTENEEAEKTLNQFLTTSIPKIKHQYLSPIMVASENPLMKLRELSESKTEVTTQSEYMQKIVDESIKFMVDGQKEDQLKHPEKYQTVPIAYLEKQEKTIKELKRKADLYDEIMDNDDFYFDKMKYAFDESQIPITTCAIELIKQLSPFVPVSKAF